MKRILVLLTLLTQSACLPIYNQKVWEPGVSHATFDGIDKSLQDSSDEPISVLIVHGMGNQTINYPDSTIQMLSDELQLCGNSAPETYPIKRPGSSAEYGAIRVQTFYHGRQKVLFYTLLWAPLTQALEETYLKFDFEKPTPGRVVIDRALKQNLIDQSFSDAFAFSGKFRPHMEYAMRAGLCDAMTGATNLKEECEWPVHPPIKSAYIVTHSLGSVLLLETLKDMLKDNAGGKSAALNVIGKTRMIALLANQFPLFQLTRVEQPGTMAFAPLDEGLSQGFAQRASADKLPFVAFSDPNDLLSFPIPDNWQTALFPDLSEHARFINASANNTWPLLGIVALPSRAHTHYWEKRWIIHLLSHGYPQHVSAGRAQCQ